LIEISIPDGQDYHSGLEEFNAHEGVMKHTTTAQLESWESGRPGPHLEDGDRAAGTAALQEKTI
jgi:hypothetical protein